MFKGSRGLLVADFNSRLLLPLRDDDDMTYYRTPAKDSIAPKMGGFQEEWIRACKGDLKTSCNFDCNGLMTEQMALGLVAYRAGQKLDYDGVTGRVKNSEAANAFLRREYRAGWTLNG